MPHPAIGLYTTCHAPDMAALVDPPLIPFEVAPSPHRRETAHALQFWKQGRHREHQVSAVLSAKFSRKTRLPARAFVEFIQNNPGHDVWFGNPWPHLRYFAFNIWEQGEDYHPGLCRRAARLTQSAGHPVDFDSFPRSRFETFLFCNFWAATPEFWDRYMTRLQSLTDAAEKLPEIFDPVNHYSDVTFFPFIFERYFTTFLEQNPDIKTCPWRHSQQEIIARVATQPERDYLTKWIPVIDRWDAAGIYSIEQRQLFRDAVKASRTVYDASRSGPAR